MSDYYKLVCDDCRERVDAASRSAGGWGPVGNSAEALPAFVIAHASCKVRIVSEHEEEVAYGDQFRDWGDVDEEVARAKSAGRWIREQPPGR
jgi:hypothetical protein